MTDMIQKTVQYIEYILDIPIIVSGYKEEKNLPLLIQNDYQIFEGKILTETLLLVVSRDEIKQRTSVLKKHFSQIEQKTGQYPVYLCPDINSYTRKELIKNKISFVVPENQLYLPKLGVCLREYYKKKTVPEEKPLSTIAQLVLLYHFHNRDCMGLTPSYLAERLGYTVMSFSRAFKELEARELGAIEKLGRKTIIHFRYKGEELWSVSMPFLSSPVKRTVSLSPEYEGSNLFAVSGLSALSQNSMINPPHFPEYAMQLRSFNALKKTEGWEVLPDEATDSIQVQLWRYNPLVFSKSRQVDMLSLYLSLKDNTDERVESALEEFLEDFKW